MCQPVLQSVSIKLSPEVHRGRSGHKQSALCVCRNHHATHTYTTHVAPALSVTTLVALATGPTCYQQQQYVARGRMRVGLLSPPPCCWPATDIYCGIWGLTPVLHLFPAPHTYHGSLPPTSCLTRPVISHSHPPSSPCSKLSVVLTLWADNATRADLEGCEGQVMQVGEKRVREEKSKQ